MGRSILWYADERVKYEVAKYQCEALQSKLVEFWTEAEWFEVSLLEILKALTLSIWAYDSKNDRTIIRHLYLFLFKHPTPM